MEVGGKLPAPAAVPPRNNAGTYQTGGWVWPTSGLDVLKTREKSLFPTGLEHRTSSNYF